MISNAGTGSSEAALITDAEHPYFAYPFSLAKLPDVLRRGLPAPGTMGLLSVTATFCLLCLLLFRSVGPWKTSKSPLRNNQYLVLFLNLLIADMLQGMSFVLSFWWIHIDAILAPTVPCHIQGALLNIGNVTSGFFVLLVACQTFYSTVLSRRLSDRAFVSIICATWTLGVTLTIIGPAIHGRNYFVRTGAWCWASALYETDRLALHYVYIFSVQFATMVIYLAVFFHIKVVMRRTSAAMNHTPGRKVASHSKIDRAARSMVLYPLAYIILTLPLSAARMWSIANHGAFLPSQYVLVAGTLIASSGWVDCLLYTATRQQIMSVGMSTNGTKDKSESNFGMGEELPSNVKESTISRSASRAGLSRPNIARAISARSLKPILSPDDKQPQRSLSVGLNIRVSTASKDPYGTDTIDLERGASVAEMRSASMVGGYHPNPARIAEGQAEEEDIDPEKAENGISNKF